MRCMSEWNNFYEIAVPAPLFVSATRSTAAAADPWPLVPPFHLSSPTPTTSTLDLNCQPIDRNTHQTVYTAGIRILVRPPPLVARSFVWYSSSANSHHVVPSRMFAAVSSVPSESIYISMVSRNPYPPLLIAARRSLASEFHSPSH